MFFGTAVNHACQYESLTKDATEESDFKYSKNG